MKLLEENMGCTIFDIGLNFTFFETFLQAGNNNKSKQMGADPLHIDGNHQQNEKGVPY